jgi:hypothetical protein
MIRECLQCKNEFKIRNKTSKFCSKKCSNIFNGNIVNQLNKNKKICLICCKEKTFNFFSRIDKSNKFSGVRDVCKNCSRAKTEREKRARTWEYDAAKIMLMNSKHRAKMSGIEFSITEEDIKIPEKCPVLEIPLFRCKKDNWNNSPSIDRIDNTKGYTKDNIVIVSRRANILKKDATIDELQKLANFYKQYCQV